MPSYRRRPAVERRLSRGRRLVQPVGSTTPRQLAGSAPLIWDLLASHHDLDGLIDESAHHFSDSREVVDSGTRAAVRMLLDGSLIEEVDS